MKRLVAMRARGQPIPRVVPRAEAESRVEAPPTPARPKQEPPRREGRPKQMTLWEG